MKLNRHTSQTTRDNKHLWSIQKCSQLLVVWRFWVPSSSSARELQAFLSELVTVFILHRHSSSEAPSLSLLRPQNLTWENSLNFLIVLYFSYSLWAPVLCIFFTLSGSLVSFYIFTFSSVVPSVEYRHSFCSETGLVRATPDQKFASVPCAARTRLVPQHLIKTTGWLSSGLWKIGLERLSPDQK